MDTAPERGVAIGATAIQVFTKTPNQWREPALTREVRTAFRRNVAKSGLRAVISHDSYLINLASPDPALSARSIAAFTSELKRCQALGIRQVVSHPGNYIDDRNLGLRRNAAAYTACLRSVPGRVQVLLETTAGTGTALGSTFEELAELKGLIPAELRRRVGFCADTCHLYSTGYDLVGDFDGVWAHWDRVLGLRNLKVLHLNDSQTPFGSHRDRHALIGEGSLGPEPFRRLMTDPRFAAVIKILETPKGDRPEATDRKMLRRLRSYVRTPGRASVASARRRADL